MFRIFKKNIYLSMLCGSIFKRRKYKSAFWFSCIIVFIYWCNYTQGSYKLLPIPIVRSDLSLSLEYRRFHDKYKFQIPARVNNLSCWACLLCRRFPLPAVRKVSAQEDHLLNHIVIMPLTIYGYCHRPDLLPEIYSISIAHLFSRTGLLSQDPD